MSIIAQQTPITLHNNTKYYVEIKIIAEIPIANGQSNLDHGLYGAAMDGLLNLFTGSKLHEIRINLPAGTKVPISVRCTSTLYFTTNVISKQCSDIIEGDFELDPQYHGEPMRIEWHAQFGYDHKGDVALGGKIPSKRDFPRFIIRTKFSGPDVTPACCKINFTEISVQNV